ncbi:MAG TPA: AMP-binding protein [Acidimicrobiia bacterium]|jgi:fatty-acyl-CoA synthase
MTRLAPVADRRAALEARQAVWRPLTIAAALDAAAARHPDRPFILADDRSFTYGELREWSERLAAGLVALGVGPGDHVALVMANYPEYLAVKFAIARAGAVCIPVNYLFRRNELGYVLGQSDTTVLITMDRFRNLDYAGALDELSPGWRQTGGGEQLPKLRHVVVHSPDGAPVPGARTLADLEALGGPAEMGELARRAASADPGGSADVIYTSGTTGMPKGVLVTHDMLLRTAYASAFIRAFQDGRRILFSLPLYHVFGYVEATLAVLFVGGSVVPQPVFDPVTTLEGIARHRPDEVMMVPTMTLAVLDALQGSSPSSWDVSSVSAVFSSGGQSPVRIWQAILDAFGAEEVFTAYGMTETTASATCTRPEDPLDRLATTHGRLKPAGVAGDPALGGHLAVYKAVDPTTGADVGDGTEGELVVRGPIVTPGYYRKPTETAAAFDAQGWFRTGDLGRIDPDGTVTLTGRLKEMYKCGGELVVPKEVEDVLTAHPTVAQAHVVGVPDERMGEVGCACVVARENEKIEDGELIDWCAARLARFKVPRHVVVMDAADLPTSATGKVQKFLLVQRAQERLSR